MDTVWIKKTWVWHKPSWRRSPLIPPESHQNLHRTGDTDSWKAQTKSCAQQDPGKRSSDTTRDWPRLSCECPGVSREEWFSSGLLKDQGHWLQKWVLGIFERDRHYLHYLHHSLVSGQTTGREHSPAHQQKIGLKIYWACPCPSEQEPVSPTVSLFQQGVSISLLSLSIKECKLSQ